MRIPLGTVFCRAAGCMVYGTIFSGYDTILCCAVSLLPSINVTSQTKGALMQFEGVALGVALNRPVYSLFNICGAKSFVVRRFEAKEVSINVAEAVTKLTEDDGARQTTLQRYFTEKWIFCRPYVALGCSKKGPADIFKEDPSRVLPEKSRKKLVEMLKTH